MQKISKMFEVEKNWDSFEVIKKSTGEILAVFAVMFGNVCGFEYDENATYEELKEIRRIVKKVQKSEMAALFSDYGRELLGL